MSIDPIPAAPRAAEDVRFRALVERSWEAIVMIDAAGVITYASPAVTEILGYAMEEYVGTDALDRVHAEDLPSARARVESLLQYPGLPVSLQCRVRHQDGSWRWVEAAGTNLLADPDIGAIVCNFRDITERKRAEEALGFLRQSSALLASSLDYENTLERMARLAVPFLADWCAIDLLEDAPAREATIRRVAVVHADPAREPASRLFRELYPPNPRNGHPIVRVLRSGASELISEVPEQELGPGAEDPERARLLRELGVRSFMIVPLRSRGRVLGALTLVSGPSGRVYDAADLSLAEELAGQAATAVDNARLYREARAAEQRHRELVEGLDGIVWEAEVETCRYTFVSRRAEEILGYPVEQWLGEERFWLSHLHPEDRERAARISLEALRAGRDYEFEYRMLAADGGTVWLRDLVRVVRDAEGRPRQVRGIMVNISQRKQAEIRRQTVTDGLRAVLSAADELILCREVNTVCRRAVELARDRLGLDRCAIFLEGEEAATVRGTFGVNRRRELIDLRNYRCTKEAGWLGYFRPPEPGEPRWSLFEGRYLDLEGDQEIVFGHGWIAATPIRSPAGAVGVLFYDAAITGAPFDETKQDVVTVFCSLLGNIIERKRAEEALLETNDRLRALIEAAPLAIFTLDAEARVQSWNPAAEAMFGWRESEVLGRQLPTIPEDKISEARALCRRVLQGEALTGMELRRRRKDGSPVDIRLYSAPLYDSSGTAVGILTLAADVTGYRQLEEQFRHSQKMEAVGRLAGGVAHDFNNMLAVINGYAELLQRKVEPGSPVQQGLEEIRKAGDRAADLTRQLLAFSRKQVITPRELDLNQLVTDLQRMLERLIGEDVAIVTRLCPDLGRVKADPGQTEQVLMNLAVNARDAMPHGGTLTIRTENVDLDAPVGNLGGVKPGAYVLLSVEDTGCGMDAETRARIFEPFFTTKERGRGTGLGLATAYAVAEQCGGHITVDSEPGEGAHFRIYLPRSGEPVQPLQPPEALPVDTTGSETILLAEDEPMVRGLARKILEACGYTVLEAGRGSEAVALAERFDGVIDLLLTDVVMPGMNGRELVERLLLLRPETKVLYMSGYTDDRLLRHGALEPGMALIEKPFAAAELARAVREVLG